MTGARDDGISENRRDRNQKRAAMTVKLSCRRIGEDEITYPEILRLRAYLDAKRGGRPFAARRDILPEELGFALGRLILMDVRNNPLDFIYRLYGSEISAGDHDEVTRKSVYDQPPGVYRDLVIGCYTDAVDARQPVYHEMMVTDGRRTARFQRGLFPLSSDGATIDMLLSITWWNDDLTPLWDDFLAEQGLIEDQ